MMNSSPPSAAYMCQSTRTAIIQVVACHLFGTKPLPEPMLTNCQLDPKEQTSVEFKSKYMIFIHKNAFENVICEMAAISFMVRWVNVALIKIN